MGDDRYDELMGRRAALEQAVHERMRRHQDEMMRQAPLLGRDAKPHGSHTEGIRLAGDGSLDARLDLHDIHGRTSTVWWRADPHGEVEEHVVGAGRETDSERPPRAGDETEERLAVVTRLAGQHLPADVARDFVALLRPALRLEHAGEGDPVVAQLGGLPSLPINSWPVWDDHGPLSHVLSFDCEPVGALLPELGLPATGHLAFFYFDGSWDHGSSAVGTWDPASRPGFRVVHVQPERAARHDRLDAATPAPPGLVPFRSVALTAVRTLSWPAHGSPTAESLWSRAGLVSPRPGVPAAPVEALYGALHELPGGGYDTHQIGGYAHPQQDSVELEVEELRRGLAGEPFEWSDPDVQAAASEWQLLLQVASDDAAAMMWSDAGQLYYLVVRPDEPEEALCTLQCG